MTERFGQGNRAVILICYENDIAELIIPVLIEQRQMAESSHVVMEGRDIGTVVFPNADCKIFLTASPERRAERRYREMSVQGKEAAFENVLQELIERDNRDSGRAHSPLRQAPDAVYLDSTDMTLEDVIAFIQEQIKQVKE